MDVIISDDTLEGRVDILSKENERLLDRIKELQEALDRKQEPIVAAIDTDYRFQEILKSILQDINVMKPSKALGIIITKKIESLL